MSHLVGNPEDWFSCVGHMVSHNLTKPIIWLLHTAMFDGSLSAQSNQSQLHINNCLFVLRLNVPVNNVSVMSGWRNASRD